MKKVYSLPGIISFPKPHFFQNIFVRNVIFKKLIIVFLCLILLSGLHNNLYSGVTLTSSTHAAASINQGTGNNIIYIAKMAVATSSVTVNKVQFTLSGTQDANDLVTVLVYFNATSASFSGSSFLGSAPATFAAPHAYSITISKAMATGSSGYFLILANVSSSATDNKTIKINGATSPVIFGFTTSTTVTNNQTDVAGTQTIQAADITLTSSTHSSASINQGTSNNIIYVAKMAVATEPVTVNNIQFTFGGTQDANDLVTALVYFNATSASFTGSSFLGSAAATFAAPHAYSITISKAMATGSSGYFLILANVSSSATDNKTIKINGLTSPVTFGYTTSPNKINNQTDVAGTQTIQAADITLTSSTHSSASINQGTSNNIIYVAKMAVATEPVTINNIQFTFGGTQDANDLVTALVYFNATSASFTGSSFLGSAAAIFAAPHAYSIAISKAMATGSSGYFLILANVSSSATDNKTIKINGLTSPVTFGYTTSPNKINSQTDVAGTQTIQAADITLTSSTHSSASINQGTSNNIIYIAKMAVATEPVTVNNIQFTFGGTQDANDLVTALVYFNATSASFTGSSFLGSAAATFAAPHAYSIAISKAMATGSSGYFLILANVSSSATDNKTIKINGLTSPVTFGYTTSPNKINNQTDVAGTQTIQAADITLTSSTHSSASINQGTSNNIIYIAKMAVATEPVTVNNIQFTFGGTQDANDLVTALVYFNATSASFTGSSFLGSAAATFAAPHAYSIAISKAMATGSSGYFLILANVSSSATDNKTIKINGLTSPVTFGYTTSPNKINSQTDVAGTQTIQAADITLTSSTVAAGNIKQGTSNNIIYIAKMAVATEPVTVNNIQFTFSGTHDANDLVTALVYFNATSASFTGSSFLGSAAATFAAPHTYSISISKAMATGSSGYFLILANVSSTATISKTVKINGATSPVVFGFITSPNIINNQTDVAGTKTIIAAGLLVVAPGFAQANNNQQTDNSSQTLNNNQLIEYRPAEKINLNKVMENVIIYPNPVTKNGSVNLEMQNLKKGYYVVTMFNPEGQQIIKKIVEHHGGSAIQIFSLPANAFGTYIIKVENSNSRFVKTLVIE